MINLSVIACPLENKNTKLAGCNVLVLRMSQIVMVAPDATGWHWPLWFCSKPENGFKGSRQHRIAPVALAQLTR
jgi:hypothetical protein